VVCEFAITGLAIAAKISTSSAVFIQVAPVEVQSRGGALG
jgi:hypothetical protein